MTRIFYTSDPHFGHRLVAKHRGFGTAVDAHDEMLCDNWRSVVNPEDHVWVLGDIAVSSPWHALELLSALPGHKHLVAGNHDGCHSMHRKAWKLQPIFLTAFESVQIAARRNIAGKEVLLSHFPYTADRGEARYTQWRLPDEGLWLLHGHTHSSVRETSAREIHVGMDAWDYTPVAQTQIEELINAA